jgi:CheY-like chemotaxis protein
MHAQADPIPRHAGDRITVLIVEDERLSRRALATLLASYGFEPTAVASAEEALREVRGQAAPRVALVDVDLPGMSGLDLVSRLEKLCPGIRAVLITAAEGERIARFRHDHPVDYLPKPVDFPRLLMLLSRFQPAH